MITQLKNNKYKIVVDVGHDSKGKRKRVFETFNGSKKDAKIREAEIKKQVKFGTYIKTNNLTFKDLATMYFEKYAEMNLSEKTIEGYKQLYKVLDKYIGTIPVQNINVLTLTNLYQTIKYKHSNREVTNNTILHYYHLVNSILNYGVSLQLIPINVNTKIKRPKVVRKEMNCYDEKETLKLIECLKNEPLKYQALIRLAIDTGARRSEIVALSWNDINFTEQTVLINKSAHYINKKIVEKETKNYSSNRKIKITDSTTKILLEYKNEQEETKKKFGSEWVNSNKIFTQRNGEIMFPDSPSKLLKKVIKKYNLKTITFHQLRHTSASLQIALGLNPKLISNRLGHSSTSTTLNIYSHIFKSAENEAVNKLETILSHSI